MSHIPKRAVQHGVFMSSMEVLPTDLKPGQKSLTRQVYLEEARAHEETYLNQDRPRESVYATETSKLLTPEAYKSPTQPVKPQEPPTGYGHHGTAHWRSTTHAIHNAAAIQGAQYYRQHGPSYQAANPPTCVSAADVPTNYHEFHGRYGSNPRDKVHPLMEKLPIFKTVLNEGTHKGTMHIPGYQGFLASNTANEHVARVTHGATLRSVDKTNLTEQFHTNLVAYAGHVPKDAFNDRGGVKPNVETMMGRSFTAPMLHAAE